MFSLPSIGHILSYLFVAGGLALGCWMLSLVLRPQPHDDDQ